MGWRQSRRGRASERSSTLFFPIDGFAGQTDRRVRAAVEELAALLREQLGAATTTAMVDAAHPFCPLLRFPLISDVPPDGDAIDELLGRGVVDLIKREEIEPRLRNGERLKVKLGMDPTGPLLHVGRATRLFNFASSRSSATRCSSWSEVSPACWATHPTSRPTASN